MRWGVGGRAGHGHERECKDGRGQGAGRAVHDCVWGGLGVSVSIKVRGGAGRERKGKGGGWA